MRRHNTIPIRHWWRRTTVCIQCQRFGVSDKDVCP